MRPPKNSRGPAMTYEVSRGSFVDRSLCALRVVPDGARHAEENNQTPPLAGEPFKTEVLGEPVTVHSRDRKSVTAASFGVQYLHDGQKFFQILPFGALYVWRNSDDEKRRFRGTFSGAVNDMNVESSSSSGWELRFTFNNMIIPLGRSEYVEGQIIQDVELEWNYVFGGIGLAYRTIMSPGHQDNALEMSLTYEPGYRWFNRSQSTAPDFVVPTDCRARAIPTRRAHSTPDGFNAGAQRSHREWSPMEFAG